MAVEGSRRAVLAWLMLGLGVTAYGFAVLNRASLGVAAIEAQSQLGVSSAVLGLLSVVQVGVYATMQVPVGAFLDRWGPRIVITSGLMLMGLGQFGLASASTAWQGIAARMLVGAGDAMVFISVIRCAVNWFPVRQLPMVTQMTAIVGQCGQLAASFPLIALLAARGWSATFAIAGAATMSVAVLVGVFLRDSPVPTRGFARHSGWTTIGSSAAQVWRIPGVRAGFWCHFTVQFPGMLFVLIWGYPYLVEGQGRTPGTAGALLAWMVPMGLAAGLALGVWSARRPRARVITVLGFVALSAATWGVVLVVPRPAPGWLLVVLVSVLATNLPASMMGLDIARESAPKEHVGVATGIANGAGFFAAVVAILLIGIVLDLRSAGGPRAPEDFAWGMASQFVVWGFGSLWLVRGRKAVTTCS